LKLGPTSTLADVAITVGDTLRRHRIRAVLTGGACASLYTAGHYTSVDADFVVLGHVTRIDLDDAMGILGFRRVRDRYVHPDIEFYVEFLPGPVAIGEDDAIKPTTRRRGAERTLALTPTDSCRDRLAAFFHWKDRQSLDVAIQIALRNRVDWKVLGTWSKREGFEREFAEFRELAAARRR
jgi:hypothetical protein